MQGYSTLAKTAGIYGSHANDNGIGVMGEMQNESIAVYGKMTGTEGLAGSFVSISQTHNDTTLNVSTQGIGKLSTFTVASSTNSKPAISVSHAGDGIGLSVFMGNQTGSGNAVDGFTNGTGVAVHGTSHYGIAGRFDITNEFNSSEALSVSTVGNQPAALIKINNSFSPNALLLGQTNGIGNGISLFLNNPLNTGAAIDATQTGKGKGMKLVLSNPANTEDGLYVSTLGKGHAGYFNGNSFGNNKPALRVNQNGTTHGIEVTVASETNNANSIYANSAGFNGIKSLARNVAIEGQATALDKRQFDGSQLTYTLINAIKEQQVILEKIKSELALVHREYADLKKENEMHKQRLTK